MNKIEWAAENCNTLSEAADYLGVSKRQFMAYLANNPAINSMWSCGRQVFLKRKAERIAEEREQRQTIGSNTSSKYSDYDDARLMAKAMKGNVGALIAAGKRFCGQDDGG